MLAPGRVVLLGEMHGTEESPAFPAGLACRRTVGSPWDPAFEPMGYLLAAALPGREIVTLDVPGHHDGAYCVGTLHASAPALPHSAAAED